MSEFRYTCAICKETFLSDRDDDQAQREDSETWQMPVESMGIVCEDCFNEHERKQTRTHNENQD